MGWFALLNYWGGAFCYFQKEYAVRIKIIHRSWREANKSVAEPEEETTEANATNNEETEEKEDETPSNKKGAEETAENAASGEGEKKGSASQMKVPSTFREMFLFNAAVMGFGNSKWMDIILDQFDALVINIANSYRLQESA
ncbi:unnamed protein product [Effrenium voratum]|nr:unnamed protein product [Effrenium voratum]